MKYYLGQDFSNSYFHEVMLAENGGTKNILFSHASAKNYEKCIEIMKKYPKDTEFIIDSGAFSVWNTGGTVDRVKLLEFYQVIKKAFPHSHFINLDSIPGKKGQKPSKAEVKRACEESWDNYMFFKANNFEVLPVFHEDDEWEYLHRMMKETDYIAISPANDSSVKRRMKRLDRVYSILKADYKTHGLAATSIQLLKRYPFYSVDSINWKTALLYGRMISGSIPQHQTGQIARTPHGKRLILRREIKHFVQLEKEMTHLWAKRGIVWKD